jgi:hypothetical protein
MSETGPARGPVRVQGRLTVEMPEGGFTVGEWEGRPAVFFPNLRVLRQFLGQLRGAGAVPADLRLPDGGTTEILVHVGGRPLVRLRPGASRRRFTLTLWQFLTRRGREATALPGE